MSPRTPFLSRLIGLYAILVALSMFSRGQATVETVAALLQNPSIVFVLGVVMLAAGLAMVLAHNIWSGGALVVVVTLVGWMTRIKSLVFLFLPPEIRSLPRAADICTVRHICGACTDCRLCRALWLVGISSRKAHAGDWNPLSVGRGAW